MPLPLPASWAEAFLGGLSGVVRALGPLGPSCSGGGFFLAGRRVRPRAFLEGSPGRIEGSLMKLSSVSSSCSNSSDSRPGAGSSRCPLFRDHSLMAMSSAVICTDCANQLLKKVPSMGNEVDRPEGWEKRGHGERPQVCELCAPPFQVAQHDQATQAGHLGSVHPSHQCQQRAGPAPAPLTKATGPRTGFVNCGVLRKWWVPCSNTESFKVARAERPPGGAASAQAVAPAAYGGNHQIERQGGQDQLQLWDLFY